MKRKDKPKFAPVRRVRKLPIWLTCLPKKLYTLLSSQYPQAPAPEWPKWAPHSVFVLAVLGRKQLTACANSDLSTNYPSSSFSLDCHSNTALICHRSKRFHARDPWVVAPGMECKWRCSNTDKSAIIVQTKLVIPLTPTLNSIVPHNTSIVEFPSPKATRWIWVSRMIEQTVVKRPRRKRHTTPAFCATFILRPRSNGMGSTIMITSVMMV